VLRNIVIADRAAGWLWLHAVCPAGHYAAGTTGRRPAVPGFKYGVWGNKFLTFEGNWGSWIDCRK